MNAVRSPTRSLALSSAADKYTSAVTSVDDISSPKRSALASLPTITMEQCPSSARLPSAVLSASTASASVSASTVTVSLLVEPCASVGMTYCAVMLTLSPPSTPIISTITLLFTSRLRDTVDGMNATRKAKANSNILYTISFFLVVMNHAPPDCVCCVVRARTLRQASARQS